MDKMPDSILRGSDRVRQAIADIADKYGREKLTLRVGLLEGTTYPDGTSVPLVATVNEFGAPSRGQPPRPFFRRMIAENQGTWPEAMALNLKATGDVRTTLERMGEGIKGQLQQSIATLVDPPLAPSTVKRKGSSKPLVDSGHMLASVDWEIE